MPSSRVGRLVRGGIYGAVIGAVIGVVLYVILRGVAGQVISQTESLPLELEGVLQSVAIFGAIGAYMGCLWQIGAKPKPNKDDLSVDPETDRKLREQAAKEAAKK